MRSFPLFLTLVAIAAATPAFATGNALSVAATGGGESAREVTIKKFTIYTPKAGGINGHCGGGAYGKGVQICKQLLEPYAKNPPSLHYVAAAVPCKGSTSANAFGGAYEAPDLKGKVPGFQGDKFIIGAVDHYKCGGKGAGGKGGSDFTNNMDVAADKETSAQAEAISKAGGTTLKWVSTFEDFRNGVKRGVDRLPNAYASADEEKESLLAESEVFTENLLYESIQAESTARKLGRLAIEKSALLAFDGELPWMIPGRKYRFSLRSA